MIPGRFTPSNVRTVWDRVPEADLPSYICFVLVPGGPERTTPISLSAPWEISRIPSLFTLTDLTW